MRCAEVWGVTGLRLIVEGLEYSSSLRDVKSEGFREDNIMRSIVSVPSSRIGIGT